MTYFSSGRVWSAVAFGLVLCILFYTHLTSSKASNSEEIARRNRVGNGLGKTPPMGWNSWNRFECTFDEKLIRETADAMVSTGLADLGYKCINLDDCWAELNRDSEENLVPKASTFPSGIKALANYVHNKGLKFGIYSDAGYQHH